MPTPSFIYPSGFAKEACLGTGQGLVASVSSWNDRARARSPTRRRAAATIAVLYSRLHNAYCCTPV